MACCGNRILPKPMLTNHQWGLVLITWGQYHRKCSTYLSYIKAFLFDLVISIRYLTISQITATRLNQRVPVLQMTCSDLMIIEGSQDISPSKWHMADVPSSGQVDVCIFDEPSVLLGCLGPLVNGNALALNTLRSPIHRGTETSWPQSTIVLQRSFWACDHTSYILCKLAMLVFIR